MNRAIVLARLLQVHQEQQLVEFKLTLMGSEDAINKLGPDRWMKKVWGLTGSAAESAWWGCLDCLYGRKTR